MKNIALELYGNIGGIPWKFQHSLNKTFIGIHRLKTENVIYIAIVIIDEFGIHQLNKVITISPPNDHYNSQLRSLLNDTIKQISILGLNPDIVVHWHGNLYPNELETLNQNKIFEIKDTYGKRIYNPDVELNEPISGSYIYFNQKIVYLVTTSDIKTEGSPVPKVIRSFSGDISKTDITEIYSLTRIHIGYTRMKSGFPITIDYAKSIVTKTISIEYIPKGWSKLPWFI